MFIHAILGSLCLVFKENPEINTELHLKVTSSLFTALAVFGPYCTRPTASVQYGPNTACAVTSDSVTLACSTVYILNLNILNRNSYGID